MSRKKQFRQGNGTACTTCGEDIDTSGVAKTHTSADKFGHEGVTEHLGKEGKPVYHQYHKHYESDDTRKPVFEAGPTCLDCSADRRETMEQDSSAYWEQQRRDTDRDWYQ